VGHRLDGGDARVGLIRPPHHDLPRVGHHVGVGDDPAAFDQEAAAEGGLDRLLPPRHRPVESRAVDLHVHDRRRDPVGIPRRRDFGSADGHRSRGEGGGGHEHAAG
jgi:hypothetical protein